MSEITTSGNTPGLSSDRIRTCLDQQTQEDCHRAMDVGDRDGSVHWEETNHDEKNKSLMKKTNFPSLTDDISHQNLCENNDSQKLESGDSKKIPANCDSFSPASSYGNTLTENKSGNVETRHEQQKLLELENEGSRESQTEGSVLETSFIVCNELSTQLQAQTDKQKDDEKGAQIEKTTVKNSTASNSSVQSGMNNEEISQQEQGVIPRINKEELRVTEMDCDSSKQKEFRATGKEGEKNKQEESSAIGMQSEQSNQEKSRAIRLEIDQNNQEKSIAVEMESHQNNQEESIAVEMESHQNNQEESIAVEMESHQNNQEESIAVEMESHQNNQEESRVIGLVKEKKNEEDSSAMRNESEGHSQEDASVISKEFELNNQNESFAVRRQMEHNSMKESSAVRMEKQQMNQEESSVVRTQKQQMNQEELMERQQLGREASELAAESVDRAEKVLTSEANSSCTYTTSSTITESVVDIATTDCMPVIVNVRGNANDLDEFFMDEFEKSNSENTEENETVMTSLSYGAKGLLEKVAEKVCVDSSTPSLVESSNAMPSFGLISTSSSCPIYNTSLLTSMNLTTTTESFNDETTYTTGVSCSSRSREVEQVESSRRTELSPEFVQSQSSFITESKSIYVNSVSNSQISDSQLKSSLIACHQPSKGVKIIAGKEPRFVITLHNSYQNPIVSEKVSVTTAAVNSFSVPRGPSGNVNHLFQSTHETPTILVNSQRTRVITTQVKKNGSLPKQPIPALISSESHNSVSSQGNTNQVQRIHIKSLNSFPSTSMNRQEILQSGLLKISKKTRSDMSKQHVCNVCGEEFYTEKFLHFHLERSVFVLKYFCSECLNTLTFNNKCAFWQHIFKEVSNREERLENERTFIRLDPFLPQHIVEKSLSPEPITTSSLTQPTIEKSPSVNPATSSSLPQPTVEKSPSSNPVTSSSLPQPTVEKSRNPNLMTSSSLSQHTVERSYTYSSNPATFESLLPIATTNTQYTSPAAKGCPYCFKMFSTPSSLRCHFEEISKSPTSKCAICEMIFLNPCSMAAHRRIHTMAITQMAAHCPECGVVLPYSQDLRAVFEHLDNCYHFNVWPRIICKCGAEKKSVNEMKEHILKDHLSISLHRRPGGTLFKYLNVFNTNDKTRQPQDLFIASPLIKCSLCHKVFQTPSTLQKHVEAKAASFLDGTKQKRYKCTLCSLLFVSASQLGEHIDNVHTHKPKRCTMCFGLFKSRQNLVSHLVSKSCPKKFPKYLHECLDSSSENEMPFDNTQYTKLFQLKSLNASPSSTAAQTHSKVNNNVSIPISSNEPITSQIHLVTTATSASASNERGHSTQTLSRHNHAVSQPRQSVHPQKRPNQFMTTQLSLLSQSGHPQKQSVSEPNNPGTTQRQSNNQISQAERQKNQLVRVAFDKSKRPPSAPARVVDGRQYQCHLCKICLIGSKNFEKHMSHHNSSDLVTGRTHCVVCKKKVIDSSIRLHLEKHQSQGVIVCTLCHRRDFSSVGQARDHSRNWCYYKEERGWGEAHFKPEQSHSLSSKTRESGSDHIGQEKNQSYTDDNGDNSPPEPNSNENEALVFPCLMCGLAFTTKQAKDDHVSRVHDGTKTLFFCALCRKKGTRKAFSRKHKASLHISRKHRIINYPTAISKYILEEERNLTSGQVVPFDTSTQESRDAPPPKRLRLEAEGTFLCGKCGFSEGQRDSFDQHIKSHNLKNEPQCPECGLCFTVFAALKKHIFAVHKIKRVDEFLKERGIEENVEEVESEDEQMDSSPSTVVEVEVVKDCNPRPPKSSKRKSSGSSNNQWECTVCYKKYSCEAVLKSHMRNHGMAFIRSRRHILKSQAPPVPFESS